MGGSSIGGCVGGVSTGGSVGRGSTGVFVAGGSVGGMSVAAGLVSCTSVGAPAVGLFGSPSLGRGVEDTISVRVGVGVRVRVGVALGSTGVVVGVFEAVAVGAVDVGNGPMSAPAVAARAVFVSAACCLLAGSEPNVSPKARAAMTMMDPIHKRTGRRTCCSTSFSLCGLEFIFESFRSSCYIHA